MINIRYKLVEPRNIVEEFVDEEVLDDEIIVKPKYLSICHADQRYYQGNRDKKVLSQKLPLSLIHEGIGEIIYSRDDDYKVGTNVVMLPNISTSNGSFKENYDKTSKFRGSTCDGFMQNCVVCKKRNVLKINSDKISMVFLELMSVVFNALDGFNNYNKKNIESIAVYGDGSLSFIMALVLRRLYSNTKIIVIGKHKEKMDYFTFVDEKYVIDKVPSDLRYSHAFECVGGIGSESAIKQIIDIIDPQGTACLLGVSEYSIQINTRLVLEKGLCLLGSSRSSMDDFRKAIDFIDKYPDTLNYLNTIISDIVTVKDIKDMDMAFMIDTSNPFKTIMKWEV